MKVEVSLGEVFDKISILIIKLIKIKNVEKLIHIKNELLTLLNAVDFNNLKNKQDFLDLISTNAALWDIEDNIRIKERAKEFDEEFIDLARSVYITNDKRFSIKNNINVNNSSTLNEVKSYEEI
jgi:hypothetical protein